MRYRLVLLLLLIGVLAGNSLLAEEKPLTPEEEDKIAAKEDAEAEEKMVLGQKTTFTGTVTLDDAAKTAATAAGSAIGMFSLKDGKSYILKAASDAVFKQLKAFDGKVAMVNGNIRVNGKYMIVLTVIASPTDAGQRDKRKKSGL